nr:reverse transcriptase domain-containing protein [Tanacetum cinerariifolium]
MDKVHRDRRKDVHTRLDFGEGPRERTREDSHHSSARAQTKKLERLKVQDHLRYGDHYVPDRLGHRRQSAFDRLNEIYLPSTTKSRPRGIDSRDRSQGRSRPYRLYTSNEDCPNDRERFCSVGESMMTFYPTPIAVAHVERWVMTTWCHMFNSTLIGAVRVWFDELPPESIDSYKYLKAAFLAYFMQQKNYVKDQMKIHNIKQKDEETIKDFMKRFKVKTGRMKGAPECMRISRFMHRLNNLELKKRLNEHVSKTMEEMMITTTAFIRGEAAASKKKGHTSWKAHAVQKENFRQKPPPPMVTPVEKRSSNKFCDFHNDKGHNTNECMQLKKQIVELVRAGKLSHLIKEIKHGRHQSMTGKKETPAKDKPTTIFMIQSWQRMTRKKVTQIFERVKEITFPPLIGSSGIEGPLVKKVEMVGQMIHCMFVDGGSSMDILYEHYFNRIRPKIKSQMVLTTTSLTGLSGKTIWPLGQLRLLLKIGDTDYSIRAWINFMIVKSLSPYSGIIGRPGIREIQAVPSTAHRMLKFLVEERIVTMRSIILIPTECSSVITSSSLSKEERTRSDNFKVALHPEFPDQEVEIEGTLSEKERIELCSILKK